MTDIPRLNLIAIEDILAVIELYTCEICGFGHLPNFGDFVDELITERKELERRYKRLKYCCTIYDM